MVLDQKTTLRHGGRESTTFPAHPYVRQRTEPQVGQRRVLLLSGTSHSEAPEHIALRPSLKPRDTSIAASTQVRQQGLRCYMDTPRMIIGTRSQLGACEGAKQHPRAHAGGFPKNERSGSTSVFEHGG